MCYSTEDKVKDKSDVQTYKIISERSVGHMMHSVRNSCPKRFQQYSITAFKELITSPDTSHCNTTTTIRTVARMRSMQRSPTKDKVLRQEVQHPLKQQPSNR